MSQNQEKMRALKYQYSSHCELVEGSRVCLRSSPVYSVGTKAIHIKGTQIQVGVVIEQVGVVNESFGHLRLITRIVQGVQCSCSLHILPHTHTHTHTHTHAVRHTPGGCDESHTL